MKDVTVISDKCETQISLYLSNKLSELYKAGWEIAHYLVTPTHNSFFLHTIVLERPTS